MSLDHLYSTDGRRVTIDTRPRFVYRLFDAEGILLYIGCTAQLEARLSQHRSSAKLSGFVGVRATEYPDAASGFDAERNAIISDRPILNVIHNTGKRRPAVELERRAGLALALGITFADLEAWDGS